MPKLFAVLLGGRAKGCHIELHDVVFIIGESLEDLYPQLVNKWFGKLHKSLHIDASVELKYIDGHEIILSKQRPREINDKSLYFTNFGGYKPGFFGEIHEMNFYVAADKAEVVARAKQELCQALHLQHCDDNLPLENLINESGFEEDDICVIDKIEGYYIQLVPSSHPSELLIQAHYRKLNLPDIIEKANELKMKRQVGKALA